MIKDSINMEEILLLEKFKRFELKLNCPVEGQKNKPIVVYNFIFSDESCGTLKGYICDIGPFFFKMDDCWVVPVGVYTDCGDCHHIFVDIRESEVANEPFFRIGNTDYYHRILCCLTSSKKVDPKTGILIQ